MGKTISKTDLSLGADVSAYQKIITRIHDAKLLWQRILRAIPAAVLLGGAIFLILRKRKEGATGWIVGAVAYALLFNFRYVVLSKKTYSLSSVTGEMDLILYTAITAALAFLIAFLVNILINKLPRKKAVDAVLDIIWIGLHNNCANGFTCDYQLRVERHSGYLDITRLPDELRFTSIIDPDISDLWINTSVCSFYGISDLPYSSKTKE